MSYGSRWFTKLVGADKSVNPTLKAKARALAGIKGYINRARLKPAA
jgi:hypothetical protein